MTANERFLSDTIRHQLALQRYSNGAVRKIIAILNRSAAAISASLIESLSRLDQDSFTVERLELLLHDAKNINAAAYRRFDETLTEEMRLLTEYEVGYQRLLFASIVPAQVLIEIPLAAINAEQVFAAAMARPFQGALLREWASRQEAQAMQRIRDKVRTGFTEQRTISEIVRDVRGTKSARYEDGVMAISRREAEAVVRTAVSHTAGFARDKYFEANSDLIKQQQWVSTLDSRTTPFCLLRDGKLYDNKTHKPVGHSLPWGAGPSRAHWACRSSAVPILVSFRDLGIDIDEFSASTRASMDGQVPAKLTYSEWLKQQSAATQDDVLGATRGKLLRSGGMTVDKFANDKGRWLDLDELRSRDAAAFKRAGV